MKYPTDPRGDDASRNYQRGMALMQSLRSSGGMPYQGKSTLHPARDAFLDKSHRTWRL